MLTVFMVFLSEVTNDSNTHFKLPPVYEFCDYSIILFEIMTETICSCFVPSDF